MLSSTAMSVSLQAAPASYALPDNLTVDKLGVDLGSLMLERRDTFLSVGDLAAGGLTWSFITHVNEDPYDGWVSYWGPPAAAGYQTQVKIAGAISVFTGCQSGACQDLPGSGTTLVNNGTNWIYTANDGSIYSFSISDTFSSYNNVSKPIVTLGKLLSIKRPNGVLLTLNYQPYGQTTAVYSVVSSGGYALKYDGGAVAPTKISAINLANHTCDATITTCDGVDSFITFSSFSNITSGVNGLTYSGTQITAPNGENWRYGVYEIDSYVDPRNVISWSTRDGLTYFKGPDGHEIGLTYDAAGRITSFADNRGTFTYAYPDEGLSFAEHGSTSHTISVTDPSGAQYFTAHVNFGSYTAVDYVQDALSNRTLLGVDGGASLQGPGYVYWSRPKSVTHPENDTQTLTRDARGNVTTVTYGAKSGGGTITVTASYPSTCTNPVTCNKPTWTRDANLNQTDYTYDPTHGGVLTEMQPAPSSGAARPLKVTTWTAKYPWYKNPSGTLVQGPTQIYVMATQTECQTVAGSNTPTCDGSAPQKKTTYEYGPDGTANNLMVKAVVVSDGTTYRRTCFGYDNLGNKIWETKPRGEPATPPVASFTSQCS